LKPNIQEKKLVIFVIIIFGAAVSFVFLTGWSDENVINPRI
jgi:hypothetical protein